MLLTLAPLYGVAPISCDLHASSTPSAFNLNQDQILKKNKLLKTWAIYINNLASQSVRIGSHKLYDFVLAHCLLIAVKTITAMLFGTAILLAFSRCFLQRNLARKLLTYKRCGIYRNTIFLFFWFAIQDVSWHYLECRTSFGVRATCRRFGSVRLVEHT